MHVSLGKSFSLEHFASDLLVLFFPRSLQFFNQALFGLRVESVNSLLLLRGPGTPRSLKLVIKAAPRPQAFGGFVGCRNVSCARAFAMKLLAITKAVWSPTFMDEGRTREVLENRLQMVPGFPIAAEAVILVERGIERTTPTLFAVFVCLASLRIIGPAA